MDRCYLKMQALKILQIEIKGSKTLSSISFPWTCCTQCKHSWWGSIQVPCSRPSPKPQGSSLQQLSEPAPPESAHLWRAFRSGWKSPFSVPGLLLNPRTERLLNSGNCHQEEGFPFAGQHEGLCPQDFGKGLCLWVMLRAQTDPHFT